MASEDSVRGLLAALTGAPTRTLSCLAQDFLKANGYTNEDLVEAVKKQQAENPDGGLGLDTGLTNFVGHTWCGSALPRRRMLAASHVSRARARLTRAPRPAPRPSSCAVGVILATLEYDVFLQMISDAKTRFAD